MSKLIPLFSVIHSVYLKMIRTNGVSPLHLLFLLLDGPGNSSQEQIFGKFFGCHIWRHKLKLIQLLDSKDSCNRHSIWVWVNSKQTFSSQVHSKQQDRSVQVSDIHLMKYNWFLQVYWICTIATKHLSQISVIGQILSWEKMPNGLTHALQLVTLLPSPSRNGNCNKNCMIQIFQLTHLSV